jgi:hypothetical protein
VLYEHYLFPFVRNKTKKGKEERKKKNSQHSTLEEVEDSSALASV